MSSFLTFNELYVLLRGKYNHCPPSKHHPSIYSAIRCIRLHYMEELNLKDMAQCVNMNHCYFSQLFKEETGMNFSSYLTLVRIDQAKRLLAETNESVVTISYRCGFQSSSYFSCTFKKMIGCSPLQYRKQRYL